MTLEKIFHDARIKIPPIEELFSIKETDQLGPKIEKISIALSLDASDEMDEAINKCCGQKIPLHYDYCGVIRFGYKTNVKIEYYHDYLEYGMIYLSWQDQQYIHKIMDDYLKKEYDMTADEMWRKEW